MQFYAVYFAVSKMFHLNSFLCYFFHFYQANKFQAIDPNYFLLAFLFPCYKAESFHIIPILFEGEKKNCVVVI